MQELERYVADNEPYVEWWTSFVAAAERAVPQTRGRWALTGSRSFGLAYPESDIEGAVICALEGQDELHEQLRAYLVGRGWPAEMTTTRAGLRMLVVRDVHRDSGVDIWQLEITLRTQEVHTQITSHVGATLETWTPHERLAYIEAQRADFLARREDPAALRRYTDRKTWLRVLRPRS